MTGITPQRAVQMVAASTRVQVRDAQNVGVFAEGKVVAYSRTPMILVQSDDGQQSWWGVDLPITEVNP